MECPIHGDITDQNLYLQLTIDTAFTWPFQVTHPFQVTLPYPIGAMTMHGDLHVLNMYLASDVKFMLKALPKASRDALIRHFYWCDDNER